MAVDLQFIVAGNYTIDDDGIPGNNTSVIRDGTGAVIFTFAHPADFVRFVATVPGVNITINITDSLGAADFILGDLTDPTRCFDSIVMKRVQTTGDVTLVSNGSITEGTVDAAADIVSGTLVMSAQTGVGIPLNPIETQTGFMEAETNTGGIAIRNSGTVQIGGLNDLVNGLDVATSGDLTFTNTGSIFLSEFDLDPGNPPSPLQTVHGGGTSGNVTLTANGFAADIIANTDLDSINAPRGTISLTAGRDISFGTIGANFDNDVRAGVSLVVNAGRDFLVDGFSDMASDDFGQGTGGNVIVNTGRNIHLRNIAGTDGSIAASGIAGADVILTTGFGGALLLDAATPTAISSNSGVIVANADRFLISAASGMNAGAGSITLAPATPGRDMILGSATDAAFAAELSDAEIDRLFTPTLNLGTTQTGQVRVIAPISPVAPDLFIRGTRILVESSITTIDQLTLSAADDVLQAAASVITAGGSLSVNVDSSDTDAGFGDTGTLAGTISATVANLSGGGDGDNLNGSGFAESMFGNGGNDTLRGFGNNDILIGGAGNDTMFGGLGNDSYSVDSAADLVVEAVGEGTDTVVASVSFALGAAPEVEALITSNVAGTSAINLTGSDTNNSIQGNAGNNILSGLGGADVILGFGGTDTLDGGAGLDNTNGGPGNDHHFVDSPSDVVVEAAGEGGDIVHTSSTYSLNDSFEVEGLFATDPASVTNINLTGNSLINNIQGNNGNNIIQGLGGPDTLTGFGGADTLDGGASVDVMSGGPGDDFFIVNIATDVATEAVGEGTADTVFTSVSYNLNNVSEVERLVTTNNAGTDPINLAGNNLANNIQGNAGANNLNGLAGSDILKGFAGADLFTFTTALGPTNIDIIVDFEVVIDNIILENAVFTGLPAGVLAASAFRTGAAAADADDRIIYNPASGALFFDVDGVGGVAQVQFAVLTPGLAVTAGDFIVG